MRSVLWDCLKELFKPLFSILGIILHKANSKLVFQTLSAANEDARLKLRPQTEQTRHAVILSAR